MEKKSKSKFESVNSKALPEHVIKQAEMIEDELVCVRCGISQKENKKEKAGCYVGYGTHFEQHSWATPQRTEGDYKS